MIGNADADGFLLGQHDLGHHFAAGEDESIGPRKIFAHHPVGGIADMAIAADVGQRGAHKAERLILGPSFYLMYPFHSLLIENIAPNAVHRIRWIADNAAMVQDIDDLCNQPRLGIDMIDFQDSGHCLLYVENECQRGAVLARF